MIGNPGDTIDIVKKIKRFIEEVTVDGVHLSLATPFPGTLLWNWIDKHGRWLINQEDKKLVNWNLDDSPDAFPIFETKDFTFEERVKAYRNLRIYLRNKNLLIP
jgi:hypothetical protein